MQVYWVDLVSGSIVVEFRVGFKDWEGFGIFWSTSLEFEAVGE
jgi:hypothetical protein